MTSTSYDNTCGGVSRGVQRLALGGLAIAVIGASSGYAQSSAGPSRAFLKTPYPRIAMLWASVRGDNSVASMARHDLVMAGTGSLRLRYCAVSCCRSILP